MTNKRRRFEPFGQFDNSDNRDIDDLYTPQTSLARMARRRKEHEMRKMELEQQILEAQLAKARGEDLPATTPTRQQPQEGEVPQQVRNVVQDVPSMPIAQITAILTQKFLPKNLYRLRRTYNQSRDETESTIEWLKASGNFVTKKTKGKLKDYGNDALM